MEVFPTLIGPNDDFKELWEADLDPVSMGYPYI